ncbi:hypothetical protein [Dokdonella sp.]|uniref:hypothetical protein n=1 Tax=Dokdonella sp. TaxID=2291710 RepID=UPI003C6B23F7
MLLRVATLLLIILLPLSAAAQRIAPATLTQAQTPMFDRLLSLEVNPGLAGSGGQVVPLWASPDGRLLAIVGMSRGVGAPSLPPSPAFGGVSDLRIVDATDLFSAGLRMRLSDGLRADMFVGWQGGAPLSYDMGETLDCISPNCYAASSAASQAGVAVAGLGLGWSSSAEVGLDFSFGLSWLDGRNSQLPVIAHPHVVRDPINLSLLDMPGMDGYTLNSGRTLSARGSWQLGHGPIIDLTAALSQAELSPVWYGLSGAGLDLNQASIGLGVTSGALRGSIVGRVSSFEDPGFEGSRRWSGLDLGVSWRTPWRGEVTVGAQNLWSAPLDPANSRDADAAQARMPYVQYRQDL